MAQEEIIFKVGVDTGDSASRVASIDKEFDTLRKSIKDTEQEVEKLSKEFGANSKEVEDAKKKLDNLSVSYQELSEAATDVNAKFEDIYGELQPLTARMGEAEDRLYELALAGKQNTKEYQDLLETVARYRQTQIETDQVVDSAAQTFTQKLGGAIQGAASGFQLVQGASALFGEESEELEKTLLKVQSAMALAEGIEGIRTALPMFKSFANTIKTTVVGAFSSLKGAIASTGIGALMIAIGYLIANFDKLKSSMTQSLTSAKNFEQATTKQAEAARIANDNFDEYERTLKRLGYTEEEISNKRKARFKDAIDKTEKEIGASKKVYDEQLKNLKIVEVFDKIGFNATGRLLFGDEETAKAQQQKVKELNQTLTKLKNDQFEYNQQIKADRQKDIDDQKAKTKQANDEAINKQKERRARLKEEAEKEAQERLALQRRLEDLTVANIDDVNTREIMALKLKHDREREELVKQYEGKKALKQKYDALMTELDAQQEADRVALKKQQEAKKTQEDNTSKKAQLEAEIIRAEEDFNLKQQKRIELENLDYQQKKANTELTSGELELLKANHEKNLLDISKDSTERQKMLDEELANSKKFLLDETANMFGALAGLSEQGSAVQKAFAITQLSIDTAKSLSATIAGATAAAAATGPAAPFVLGGYIAAGVATVTKAMSSAKQILNAPMPSVQAPTINRPTEQTQNNTTQGTQTEIQAQSTYKVVVVDSDITKMQEKTKKTELISTI
jgi:predicted  nucleic acid-binding Zn-ribbon protein